MLIRNKNLNFSNLKKKFHFFWSFVLYYKKKKKPNYLFWIFEQMKFCKLILTVWPWCVDFYNLWDSLAWYQYAINNKIRQIHSNSSDQKPINSVQNLREKNSVQWFENFIGVGLELWLWQKQWLTLYTTCTLISTVSFDYLFTSENLHVNPRGPHSKHVLKGKFWKHQ